MKARVKATGEIVEVSFDYNSYAYDFIDDNGNTYIADEIQFLEDEQYEKGYNDGKNDMINSMRFKGIEPSYYDKLLHQAAIAAMQGMLSNSLYMEKFVRYAVEGESLVRVTTQNAFDYATALVNKLKEEEK